MFQLARNAALHGRKEQDGEKKIYTVEVKVRHVLSQRTQQYFMVHNQCSRKVRHAGLSDCKSVDFLDFININRHLGKYAYLMTGYFHVGNRIRAY